MFSKHNKLRFEFLFQKSIWYLRYLTERLRSVCYPYPARVKVTHTKCKVNINLQNESAFQWIDECEFTFYKLFVGICTQQPTVQQPVDSNANTVL